MGNVVYVTYDMDAPSVRRLGLRVKTLSPEEDIQQFFKNLRLQQVAIVYVSEAIYLDAHDIIDQYDDDFMVISVLSTGVKKHSRVKTRMQTVLEEAVGIKKI